MHYVIGDVHGCYDEMQKLIWKIRKVDSEAIVIFTGDFIDRGPKIIETLNFFMENITDDGPFRSVLGNHEDMILQWYREAKDDWVDDSLETLENLPKLRYGFAENYMRLDCLTENMLKK